MRIGLLFSVILSLAIPSFGQWPFSRSVEGIRIGRLVAEIDCTREYPTNLYFKCGKVIVMNSSAGAYREAEPTPDSRFGYRFKVKHVGKPHLAIVRYPDDKTRCMSVSDGTC